MVGIGFEESMADSFSQDLLPPLAIQIIIITGSGIHSCLSALRGLGRVICMSREVYWDGWRSSSYVRGVATTAAKLVLVDAPRSHSSSQVPSVFDSLRGTVIKIAVVRKVRKTILSVVQKMGSDRQMYL